jgi:hypothetical protein
MRPGRVTTPPAACPPAPAGRAAAALPPPAAAAPPPPPAPLRRSGARSSLSPSSRRRRSPGAFATPPLGGGWGRVDAASGRGPARGRSRASRAAPPAGPAAPGPAAPALRRRPPALPRQSHLVCGAHGDRERQQDGRSEQGPHRCLGNRVSGRGTFGFGDRRAMGNGPASRVTRRKAAGPQQAAAAARARRLRERGALAGRGRRRAGAVRSGKRAPPTGSHACTQLLVVAVRAGGPCGVGLAPRPPPALHAPARRAAGRRRRPGSSQRPDPLPATFRAQKRLAALPGPQSRGTARCRPRRSGSRATAEAASSPASAPSRAIPGTRGSHKELPPAVP